MSSFESEVAETARWLASPRFEGITRLYSARQVVEQRGTIQADYTVARTAAEQFYARLRELFAQRRQHHDLRPVLAGPGRGDEARGHRGHLSWRLGDVGQGIGHRGSGTRPRELSAEPGAGRSRADRARPADGRPEPALPASRA